MTNCEQLEAAGNQSMTLVREAIMSSRGAIPREARILDFGCGQGRHVREFHAVGFSWPSISGMTTSVSRRSSGRAGSSTRRRASAPSAATNTW
jgi:hypothetical protein